MKKNINSDNNSDYFGHSHNVETSVSHAPPVETDAESGATIIHFPSSSAEEVIVEDRKNSWHRPVMFGVFGGIIGGIVAFPTIDMIQSENGFNTEVPGSNSMGALVIAGTFFVSTAGYKHFRP
jgi:hypothetical protein